MIRALITTILVILLLWLGSVRVSAQSDDSCDNFLTIQSIILSEATRQPFEAQLEVARVAVTHGVCNVDSRFYSGYALAERIFRDAPQACIASIHCRAYFLLYTIPPDVRESAARASYVALTESPHVPRYHFDNWLSTAYWWDSPRACPNGYFIIAELKVC